MSDTDSIIEYSINDGRTWHHGRTIAAWVRSDPAALGQQRAVVREFARAEHGNVESVVTRVLYETDPRCVLNQPVTPGIIPGARYSVASCPGVTFIAIGYHTEDEGAEDRCFAWLHPENEDTAEIFRVEDLTRQ